MINHLDITNAQLNVICFTQLEVVEGLDAHCQRSKAHAFCVIKLSAELITFLPEPIKEQEELI